MEDPNRAQRRMSRAGDSLYQVLGLQKGASPEEIKKAYRCVIKDGFIRSLSIKQTRGIQVCIHTFFINPLFLSEICSHCEIWVVDF